MTNEERENKMELIRNKYGLPLHYYGDTVRRLLLTASLLMVATLPFLTDRLPVTAFYSVLIIVILSLVAGFMSPRNKVAIVINLLISIGGFMVFEYYAVEAYRTYLSLTDSLFIINQILAVIFLFAIYHSTKTVRSLFN